MNAVMMILASLMTAGSHEVVNVATRGQGCVTFQTIVVGNAGGPDACTIISGGGTSSAVLGGNDCAFEIELRISNWACVGPDAKIMTWQARYGHTGELPAGISSVSQPPCANTDAACFALGFDGDCVDTNFDFIGDLCERAWETPTLPDDLLLDIPACAANIYACGSTITDEANAVLDNGSEHYAMTARLKVNPGTTGSVVIPLLNPGIDSFLIMGDNTLPPIGEVIDASIHVPVGRRCGNTCMDDVTPDACVPGTFFEEGLSCPILTGRGNKCVNKNRYATVEITEPSVNQSIQITITSMPLDPTRKGEAWWAGPLTVIPNEPNAELAGAPVLCEANPSTAADWPLGLLQLYGPPIVPGAQYEVRLCDASGGNCSAPQMIETAKWGDIVPSFGGSAQPNFADVTALVDKFKKAAAAPDMVRADLGGISGQGIPDTPDQKANFADITSDVDAFKGAGFPHSIPACP